MAASERKKWNLVKTGDEMEVTQVLQPSQPLATFAPAHEVASVDTASEFQRAMMLFMQSQTSINLRMEQALLNQEKHNASQEKHNARMDSAIQAFQSVQAGAGSTMARPTKRGAGTQAVDPEELAGAGDEGQEPAPPKRPGRQADQGRRAPSCPRAQRHQQASRARGLGRGGLGPQQ